jgi:hypothetical protein
VYAITVRTAEFDLPPEMIDDLVARYTSGAGGAEPGARRGGRADEDDDD